MERNCNFSLIQRNIQSRNNENKLAEKLEEDLKLIKSAKELFVNANKSRNIYKLDEAVYKKYKPMIIYIYNL